MTKHSQTLADVMRAETAGQDLRDGPHGIHVYAMRQDQSLYELGSVSAETVYQDPNAARELIQRIKFARHK